MRALLLAFLLLATSTVRGDETGAWRIPDPDDLLIMRLEGGDVIIELAPDLAPRNVAQMKALIRAGKLAGSDFYRVIGNFVAQGGLEHDRDDIAKLPAEFEFESKALISFTRVARDDPFAPETGFWRGFALGRDEGAGRAWPIHCPGVMAMARDSDPDSASSEFYFPIGQAPRHLDRNLTVIGRVLAGFELIQGARRGDRSIANGVIADRAARTPIRDFAIASDLPEAARPVIRVMNTDHPEFLALLDAQRRRESDFWVHRPRPWLDICTVSVPVRLGE